MAKEMLINTIAGQESRIAIVDNGNLEELYFERASAASRVGSIYKGRVTNIEPSIQAAFVDFGLTKNGFLHISDVHQQFFPKGKKSSEPVGRKRSFRDRPPIQDCLRRGQEFVVQMTKEGIGSKGPTLTTYLSIPGRFLVMMPGMSRLGVSCKIEDEEARAKARKFLSEMNLPEDMGFIVRTAGINRAKRDLQRDLNYLLRLWKSVSKSIKAAKAPAEIYQEFDLVTRTIRDIYNSDIDRIVCDEQTVAFKVKEFLEMAMPRSKNRIELYVGKEGLFHDYGLEEEIERIFSRRVELASGGSLAIDQTEALVAIDINSGRFREHTDAETTALKINVEAAKEIARQLRLRDMGGVIAIDFIDMRDLKKRQIVEQTLREAIRPDRAKTKLLRMSSFCIVEMTRQRVRPSLKDSIYRQCLSCGGAGVIKSEESQALMVMRDLQRACANEAVAAVDVAATPSIVDYLNNTHRQQIVELQQRTSRRIVVRSDPALPGDQVAMTCTNNRGAEVAWQGSAPSAKESRKIETISIDQLSPKASRQKPAAGQAAQDQHPAPPEKAQAEKQASDTQRPARKKRKRRRSGASSSASSTAQTDQSAATPPPSPPSPPTEADKDAASPTDQPKAAKRKRRSRRKRGNSKPAETSGESDSNG